MSGWTRKGTSINYTKDELIEAIKDFIIETGKLPTSRDADAGRYDLPSVAVFKRHFGSWRAALEAINLPSDARGGHNAFAKKKKSRSTKKR